MIELLDAHVDFAPQHDVGFQRDPNEDPNRYVFDDPTIDLSEGIDTFDTFGDDVEWHLDGMTTRQVLIDDSNLMTFHFDSKYGEVSDLRIMQGFSEHFFHGDINGDHLADIVFAGNEETMSLAKVTYAEGNYPERMVGFALGDGEGNYNLVDWENMDDLPNVDSKRSPVVEFFDSDPVVYFMGYGAAFLGVYMIFTELFPFAFYRE